MLKTAAGYLISIALVAVAGLVVLGLHGEHRYCLVRGAALAPSRPTPPASLDCIMGLVEAGRVVAQAFPVNRWNLITAAHVVEGKPLSWHGAGTYGTTRVLSINRDEDVAILRSDTPLPCAIPIAEQAPRPMDRVWWKVLLPGGEIVPRHGEFVGIDVRDGNFLIDGLIYRGTSGSALLTDAGEAAGFVTASGPLEEPYLAFPLYFRPLGSAASIVAGGGVLYSLLPPPPGARQ